MPNRGRWPADRCWFCGRPADDPERWTIDLEYRRDEVTIPLLVVDYSRWKEAHVHVPRCGRCGWGHYVEHVLFGVWVLLLVVAIAAFIEAQFRHTLTHLGWQTLHMSGWLFGFFAWLSLREGWFGLRRWLPNNRLYARQHPEAERLVREGWHREYLPW